MPPVDLHLLDLRYRDLRIADPVRQARLSASLAAEGQKSPVLVVAAEGGRFVLIDGYARVAALQALSRDVVEAVLLEVGEAAALVLGHRLETSRRRTALEEGWLLQALVEVHRRRPKDLAAELGKTPSWVSRRLALVRALPETVQDAVRRGRLCAHAAEKYLVPLARANADHCARLVKGLGDARPTVRQMGRLYAAWKAGDDATRQRIADNPLLFLAVEDAVAKPPPDDADLALLGAVEAIAGTCGRARKHLRDGAIHRFPRSHRPQLAGAWKEARLAFDAVAGLFAAEDLDAGR